jgi:Amt family ammonium transporter
MAVMVLLVLMFALLLVRVYLPVGGAQLPGRPVGEVSLSFWERALYHRAGLYCLGAVLLLLALTGLLGGGLLLGAVLGALAVLLLPVRYRFSSEGVAVNNVLYRPWEEFWGVERRPRGLRLLPRPGLRALELRLLGSHQEEAISYLPVRLRADGRRKEGSAGAARR